MGTNETARARIARALAALAPCTGLALSASCSFGVYDGSSTSGAILVGGPGEVASLEGEFSLHLQAGAALPAVEAQIVPLPAGVPGTIGRRYRVVPSVTLVKPASVAFNTLISPGGSPSALVIGYSDNPDGPFAPLTLTAASGGPGSPGGGGPSSNFVADAVVGLTQSLGTFVLLPVTAMRQGPPPRCLQGGNCCAGAPGGNGFVTIGRVGNTCYCPSTQALPSAFECLEACPPADLAADCNGGPACGEMRCALGEQCCVHGAELRCGKECGSDAAAACTSPLDCTGQNQVCCVRPTGAVCEDSAACTNGLQACIEGQPGCNMGFCGARGNCAFPFCEVRGPHKSELDAARAVYCP